VKSKIAYAVNIMLLFLVAGVFWGTWFSLSRSITSISPQTFLEIGRIMIQNLAQPMRILFPLALVSTMPVLFILYREKSRNAFMFSLIGLALFIVALLATLLVNVPIDNQIKQWTVSTLPIHWQAIRDRWQFYHTIRTFASIAGLGFIVAGSLSVAQRD
jgi:uncharacterized membrane protein